MKTTHFDEAMAEVAKALLERQKSDDQSTAHIICDVLEAVVNFTQYEIVAGDYAVAAEAIMMENISTALRHLCVTSMLATMPKGIGCEEEIPGKVEELFDAMHKDFISLVREQCEVNNIPDPYENDTNTKTREEILRELQ